MNANNTVNIVIIREDVTTVSFQANTIEEATKELVRMYKDPFWRLCSDDPMYVELPAPRGRTRYVLGEIVQQTIDDQFKYGEIK